VKSNLKPVAYKRWEGYASQDEGLTACLLHEDKGDEAAET